MHPDDLPDDPDVLAGIIRWQQDKELELIGGLILTTVERVREQSGDRLEERKALLHDLLTDALDALHAP